MAVTRLDDVRHDLLADYRNIPDPELVARRGLFVAEGRLVVTRLLANRRWPVRSVLVTATAYSALRGTIETRPDVDVFIVPQECMNELSGFNIHRGCLAMGERPPVSEWRRVAAAAARLVVLERVGDADNVGSVFRNVAALGGPAGAVLLGPGTADPLYRKAIRTSMGAALAMPFAAADRPDQPWPRALHALREGGWHVVGLTPRADCPPLWDTAGRVADRVALVFGHEGDGLSPQALEACTGLARIPMAPGIDSLNVGVSVGVALYDVLRTRAHETAAGRVRA